MKIRFLIFLLLSNFSMFAQEPIKILSGHSSSVLSLAFSPDSKILISGSEDYTQKIWDLSSGKCLRTVYGPQTGVYNVAVSPDSKLILTRGPEFKIHVQKIKTGETVNSLIGHTSVIYGFAYSSDGKYIVSGSADKTLKIWDAFTGRLLNTFNGHLSGIKSVAFTPDNKIILSVSWDKTIKVWDVITGDCIKTLPGNSSASNIAITPDGTKFLSATEQNTVVLREIRTGKILQTYKGHTNKVASLSISVSGKHFSSGSLDGTLKIWEVTSGECLKTIPKKSACISSVAFSPDENYVVSGAVDIKIYEISLTNKNQINKIVHQKLNTWQQRGKYETPEAYKARVNPNTIKIKNDLFAKIVTDSIARHKIGKLSAEALEYDPDYQVFSIEFQSLELDPIDIKVPSSEAEEFEKNFDSLIYSKETFGINKEDLFMITHLEVTNPVSKKTYVFDTNFEEENKVETVLFSHNKELIAGTNKQLPAEKLPIRKPIINLVQPRVERGATFHHQDKKLHIKGSIQSDNGLLILLVNGVETTVKPDGYFQADVPLSYNENTILIKAIDKLKMVSLDTIHVFRPFDVSAAVSQNRKGVDYALIIATDEYQNYNKLANPIIDGTAIAEELKNTYGFLTELVKNPTRSELYTVLRSYSKRQFSDEDQLFIFIAGHGEFDEIFSEGYVVTTDSKKDDEIKESFISHSNIRTIVNNIPCKHILLTMDVCFGGTFDQFIAGSRGMENMPELEKEKFIKRKLLLTTRKYLTSGGKEYVPDGRPGFHSPFAAHFLTALRTYGGEDRILTYNEMFSIVDKAVPGPKTGEFGNNEPGSDFLFIAK